MALQARLLERLLRADGVPVEFFASNFPLPGLLRFLDIRGVRTLARFSLIWPKLWLATRRSQVVHILAASWLYFYLVVVPAVVVARICGRRTVLNYRGGEAALFFRRHAWVARPVLRLADVITSPSNFLAGVIGEFVGRPVSIVPNIVDLSRFPFRERWPLRPRMLVTRHLERIYDVESVLKAFGRVQQAYPEASLKVAGTGSLEGELRAAAHRWNLKNVEFLGHVPHAQLPGLYEQCDILLNASRVDNFPGSLLEASAAGLVVVSTGAGGIPFVYEHGKTALLVEPGDWQALANAALDVLNHSSLGRDLAAAGAALAGQYSWAEVRARLYGVYGFSVPNDEEAGAARLALQS